MLRANLIYQEEDMQKHKKNGKRILCLSMAAVMLLGSITGCGKKEKTSNVPSVETVVEATENITESSTNNETKTAEDKPAKNDTKVTDKPAKNDTKVTDKPAQNATKAAADKPAQSGTKAATEKVAESASGKENDVTKDNAAEGVTEPSGETPTEEDTEQPAETSTENESESKSTTENETQETTENVTEADRYTINLYYENNGYEKVTKDRGTLLSNIDAPLIEGKRFEGWYYDSAFKN